MTPDIRARFWAKVAKGGPDECWMWTAHRHPFGYGRLGVGASKQTDNAHRVSWRIHFGDIPEGLCVLHHCDNPPCVNPSHLFLGTHAANVADKCAKGRARGPANIKGEKHHNATMTDAQVIDARQAVANGYSIAELARTMGVKRDALRLAVLGKHYQHLPHAAVPRRGGRKRIVAPSGVSMCISDWAARIGVTRATIRRWIVSGQIDRLR